MRIYSHRVRYHEVDQQGFLFNARFLEIADICLIETFRALGWNYDDLVGAGTDPSVVKSEINYRRPARFDDVLDVEVVTTHVGRSSFTLAMTMHRLGDVVATVANTYVNVLAEEERSFPLPEEVATALRTLA